MTTSPDICELCDRSPREHETAEREGVVHHPFAGPGQPLKHLGGEVKGKRDHPGGEIRGLNLPSDPVLRFVLVQAGVVNAQQLDEAEKMLRQTGILKTHDRPTG